MEQNGTISFQNGTPFVPSLHRLVHQQSTINYPRKLPTINRPPRPSDLTAALRLSDGSRPKMINVYMGPNGLTAPAGGAHRAADGAARHFGRERGGTQRACPQRAARENQQSARPKDQPPLDSPLQIYVNPLQNNPHEHPPRSLMLRVHALACRSCTGNPVQKRCNFGASLRRNSSRLKIAVPKLH